MNNNNLYVFSTNEAQKMYEFLKNIFSNEPRILYLDPVKEDFGYKDTDILGLAFKEKIYLASKCNIENFYVIPAFSEELGAFRIGKNFFKKELFNWGTWSEAGVLAHEWYHWACFNKIISTPNTESMANGFEFWAVNRLQNITLHNRAYSLFDKLFFNN